MNETINGVTVGHTCAICGKFIAADDAYVTIGEISVCDLCVADSNIADFVGKTPVIVPHNYPDGTFGN